MAPPLPTSFVFYLGNNQYLEWGPVIDGTTEFLLGTTTPNPSPTYLNALTGTVSILDPSGAAVPGANALVLSYVAASNGVYRALIQGATFLPTTPLGQGYTVVIDLSAPAGHWERPASIEKRRST
jgi:hypothetical protein